MNKIKRLKILIFVLIIAIIISICTGNFLNSLPLVILVLILFRLSKKRISVFFIITRFGKKIEQSIKLTVLLRLQIIDNFNNGRRSDYFRQLKKQSEKEIEEFFKKTNYKEIRTFTNQSMYSKLKKLKNKGYIKIESLGKEVKEEQILEKILIYGLKTFIKNRKSEKYWDFINQKEILNNYKITIQNEDKLEEYKFTNIILQFVSTLSGIALLIVGGFKFSPYGQDLKVSDYLNFIGSFGGAILGAMMSLLILVITINNQKKNMDDQRRIDNNARKEEKERFEKEYKIKIINDKLNIYKDTYYIVKKMNMQLVKIGDNLNEKYLNDISSLRDDILIYRELDSQFTFVVNLIDEQAILDEIEKVESIRMYLVKLEASQEHIAKLLNNNEKDGIIGKINEHCAFLKKYGNLLIDNSKKLNEQKAI
ncbi:hypothetical protein [Clostridium beijerinckii]|uniref:ABC-type glycerol-3-phosphate transport system permease component n=1 Tax=Clostridium beijerinckii TaxID=1520 RepID=A0AAX0B7F3_CLOBE|nr:hypothetical protein [Clostridium beijerinckii]NRT90921.1 ABC-type glycerol-3-phosphate transport system permease component [Clostridium beijerinckii]NYC70447.1 ABC-type glycerol-3-phosphate transport system permease component [Clostridium beijerinckii]